MSARRYGKFPVEKWRDDDWTTVPYVAQWLYQYLLSQPTTDGAGVFPIRMSKWLKAAPDMTEDIIRGAAKVLVDRALIVADHETEEGLIRSFIRDDAPGDNIFKGALGCAIQAQSPTIRRVLLDEIHNLGRLLKDKEQVLVDELEASLSGRKGTGTTPSPSPATTTQGFKPIQNSVRTPSERRAVETVPAVDVIEVGLCTNGCDAPAGYGTRGIYCQSCVEIGNTPW